MIFKMEEKDLDSLAEQMADKLIQRLIPHLKTPSNSGNKRLYNIKDAAEILGRGAWAVRHMVNEGKLPCVRDGKRVFIERSAIDAWIKSRKAG